MADEKIRVKIESDYNDRDARKALRDAERIEDADPELEITSNADRVASEIRDLADTLDAEMRDAAAAADALGRALGPELSGRIDTSEAVAELRKLGLTTDEIRADADQLADALRHVDDVDMRAIDDGLGSVKSKMGAMRGEADQSRSVLANMAGNAAQDLGELGGVAGTAGVAIGQLAEYATEGNITLGNLAKVAGPMLGLAAATQLVSTVLGSMKKTDAFNKKQVEDFTAAILEAGGGLQTLNEYITDQGELLGRVAQSNALANFLGLEETKNAAEILGNYGVTLEDVIEIAGQGLDDFNDYKDAFRALGVAEEDLNDVTEITTETIRHWQDAQTEAAGTAKFFETSIGGINKALDTQDANLKEHNVLWRQLTNDMKDGTVNTQMGVDAWNQLQRELGLTNTEMAEMADQKLAEFMEADAAATQAMVDALGEYRDAVSSAEFASAGLQGATTAVSGFFDAILAPTARLAASEEAIDNVTAAIDETGTTMIDVTTGEGRAAFDALEQLGAAIMPEIAQAFVDAEGDIDSFGGKVSVIADRHIEGLIDSFVDLGYSEDEARGKANDLMIQLGIIPANVETLYELAGTEEAKLKIGLLQSAIDALPKDVQTKVTQQIIAGDYVGALATIQNYYNANPAYAKVNTTLGSDAEFRQQLANQNYKTKVSAQLAISGESRYVPASAAAETSVTNVTMYMPRGMRMHSAVREIDRYARRNGRSRATRHR